MCVLKWSDQLPGVIHNTIPITEDVSDIAISISSDCMDLAIWNLLDDKTHMAKVLPIIPNVPINGTATPSIQNLPGDEFGAEQFTILRLSQMQIAPPTHKKLVLSYATVW